MTRGLLAVQLVIALMGCAQASPAPPLRREPERFAYPAWFLDGTAARFETVGYAARSVNAALAESLAVADAAARAQAAARMQLELDVGFEAVPGRMLDSRGERARERLLADSVAVGRLAVVEARDMVLALVSRDSAASPVASGTMLVPREAPAWVNETPRDGQWQYAVGISQVYYREFISWQEAERHARHTMAMNAGVRIRGMQLGQDGTAVNVLNFGTDVVLADLAVVARWRDAENVFVLLRGRVASARAR